MDATTAAPPSTSTTVKSITAYPLAQGNTNINETSTIVQIQSAPPVTPPAYVETTTAIAFTKDITSNITTYSSDKIDKNTSMAVDVNGLVAVVGAEYNNTAAAVIGDNTSKPLSTAIAAASSLALPPPPTSSSRKKPKEESEKISKKKDKDKDKKSDSNTISEDDEKKDQTLRKKPKFSFYIGRVFSLVINKIKNIFSVFLPSKNRLAE